MRLAPGESRRVTMSLGDDALSAWDETAHAWKLYPGTYAARVGDSSRHLPVRASFEIGGK